MSSDMNRRTFITLLALLRSQTGGQTDSRPDDGPFSESVLSEIRNELLNLVNTERAVARLAPLKNDVLANEVAQKHAIEMAAGRFLSHWGRDGLKPYHRYSFAGGSDFVAENVSAFDNTLSFNPDVLRRDLTYMHMRMYSETPPDDGHRRNILTPEHTHVGFGAALAAGNLRLVENYVTRYVTITPVERRIQRNSKILIQGQLINKRDRIGLVEVFFEPIPKPVDLHWLNQTRQCGFPDDYVQFRVRLPDGVYYADGTRGSVEVLDSGRFRLALNPFKGEPGIYTVVVAVGRSGETKLFSTTAICLRSS